jgi:hypothetical protein
MSKILQRDDRQAEHERLREAVFVFARALIERAL